MNVYNGAEPANDGYRPGADAQPNSENTFLKNIAQYILQTLLLAFVAALIITPVIAAPIGSGDYDGLLVGVDQQGTLTAYFESSTGNGQFNCIFFITGTVGSSITRVKTCYPGDQNPKEVIPGTIESLVDKGKIVIRVTLKDKHEGCWNVQSFTREPVSFTLREQGGWEAIRVVSAKNAYFYNSPAEAKPRKAYAVLGNPIQVLETKTGWVRAEYVSAKNQRTQGWISEHDLFRANRPSGR